jgi:patatin-related protein
LGEAFPGDAVELGSNGNATELRLALVCYGGVSLAVYMHGITKELHKLVQASRRFDALGDLNGPNPFVSAGAPADTRAAYFEELRELARAGRRLSVSIDVIAGTSAGGINGVVLAKAIAGNAEQERLKRLWISEGDLKKLLRAPRVGGLKIRTFLAAARQVVKAFQPTSPLRGEVLSRLLVEALAEMDAGSGGTLLPAGGRLELFVTATDLHGFEVLVPSGAGGASQRDRYHGQVLQFRTQPGGGAGDFGPRGTPALAFAARATSSFPGAFAPVSVGSFAAEAGAQAPEVDNLFRYPYQELGRQAADAWLVDGGVLDNAPFDLVLDAIGRRRAESEVKRHIVYLQPDPGRPLTEPSAPPSGAGSEPEGWLPGLWHTLMVKGSHPIMLELLKLRDLNWHIAQVGAIVHSQMSEVLAQVDRAITAAGLDGRTGASAGAPMDAVDSRQRVRAVFDQLHRQAQAALGPAWPTYQRLKVEVAAIRLAEEISRRLVYPPDSGRSSFVRAALGAWARSRPEWSDPDPTRLVELLGPVDIPYRERRLLFLLAGVSALYPGPDHQAGPPRESLDHLKGRAWELLADLRDTPREVVAAVAMDVIRFLDAAAIDAEIMENPELFARKHADDFARLFQAYRSALAERLGDGSTQLWQTYQEQTKGWKQEHRLRLLSRYLGFPLWDGIIFPTVSLTKLPQFTPISVTQFSPTAASALKTPPGGKLKSVSLHHFGGFLKVDWRENDYLWGRLDGAELILRTLHGQLGGTATDPDGGPGPQSPVVAAGRHLGQALCAVLNSEQDLRTVGELRADIEAQLDTLGQTPT